MPGIYCAQDRVIHAHKLQEVKLIILYPPALAPVLLHLLMAILLVGIRPPVHPHLPILLVPPPPFGLLLLVHAVTQAEESSLVALVLVQPAQLVVVVESLVIPVDYHGLLGTLYV